VKTLEITLLAGGAALSLLGGVATARFGLAPLDNAYARQEARANASTLARPTFAAEQGQLEAAAYDGPPAPYLTDAKPPKAYPRPEARIPTGDADELTMQQQGDGSRGDAQDGRGDGDSGDEGSSVTAQPTAPLWDDVGAVGDHRDGPVADKRGMDGAPNAAAGQVEPIEPDAVHF
jgi:hypothetical protein